MEAEQILAIWERASVPALERAGTALKEFSGLDFTVAETDVAIVTWQTMAERWQQKITHSMYAVHLGAQGLFHAHILLLFSDADTQRLVGALMGEDVSLPLDTMGESALAEVGNVVGTAFLNVFSDVFHTIWEPTTPRVMLTSAHDITREIAPGTQVLLTEAMFQVTGESVSGEIVVIPSFDHSA